MMIHKRLVNHKVEIEAKLRDGNSDQPKTETAHCVQCYKPVASHNTNRNCL